MSDAQTNPIPKVEAKAFPLKEPKGNLLAFASVTVADSFAVNGVKVLQSDKGVFVGMPSAPDGKGGFRDIAFPTSGEMRAVVQSVVLDAYKEARIQSLEKSLSSQLKAGAEKAASQPVKAAHAKAKGDDAR